MRRPRIVGRPSHTRGSTLMRSSMSPSLDAQGRPLERVTYLAPRQDAKPTHAWLRSASQRLRSDADASPLPCAWITESIALQRLDNHGRATTHKAMQPGSGRFSADRQGQSAGDANPVRSETERSTARPGDEALAIRLA